MRKILCAVAILTLALGACGPIIPSSVSDSQSASPTLQPQTGEEQTRCLTTTSVAQIITPPTEVTPIGGNMEQSDNTTEVTGQAGQTGTGTGLDRDPSPEELATSAAAFAKANRSGPSSGATEPPIPANSEVLGPEQSQPEKLVYTDNTYQFSFCYPVDFVFRSQPAEKLASLKPMPAASFVIMNPVKASSENVDLEPADLEIRVYGMGQITSLESWLNSNDLLPASGTVPVKTFQTTNVAGVEVCDSTLTASGCSYFILGSGWIYQLSPATVEGETMINTFTLLP